VQASKPPPELLTARDEQKAQKPNEILVRGKKEAKTRQDTEKDRQIQIQIQIQTHTVERCSFSPEGWVRLHEIQRYNVRATHLAIVLGPDPFVICTSYCFFGPPYCPVVCPRRLLMIRFFSVLPSFLPYWLRLRLSNAFSVGKSKQPSKLLS
jgi:hypothetical protein